MQKIYRPDSIEKILQTVRPLIDAESYDEFKTYLNNLEEEQALYLADTISTSEWNPDHPPIWSYQRRIERAQYRHKRMLQKLKMQQK